MESARVLADRFELERVAGSGGMGRVFRARDRARGVPVAVKVLNAQGEIEAERFSREIEALSRLSHPAIVSYVAQGITPDDEPYLVTEWLEGEDLVLRLRRAGLTIAETLALGGRVGSALGEAHRQGIIHRDIKPGNVWLVNGRPEEAKLLDFGIAYLCRAPTITQAGATIGTPGYMAPEQARGARRIDARADVFALGCLLFRCLTGHAPFEAEDMTAVLLKLVAEEPPRVRELCPGAPAALDELIARMLAKDPAARPEDGSAVARALAAVEPGSDDHAAPVASVRPSITALDRPLMCLVLARGAAGALCAHGPTATLSDGTALLTIPPGGAFADQATLAARAARAVIERRPDAAVAVVAGRGERGSWLPMPDVIERGAGLVRRTAPGTVRVDEAVAGLCASFFEVRSDEAGLILLDEPLREGHRTLLGKPTPFVGRDREMLILEAVFDEVCAERVARAVIVTAPAGLGKSRLRMELVKRLRQRDADLELWLGRGHPMRKGAPYGMLSPMLRRLAGVLDGEPTEVRQRKLSSRVGRRVVGSDRARVTAFLGELAGVPSAVDDHPSLGAARRDALLMGEQVRRAFEDLVAAECAAGPVLLLLDDVQWGDRPSLQLIDGILRNLADLPLMALALGRPELSEVSPGLWATRALTRLALAPLSRKASERLVREVLGDPPRDVVSRIVELAEGDAFFLEELIRAVSEGRGDELPETVLAMVEQRLDGLDARERRALRAASVFGPVFWRGGVLALLGDDDRPSSVTHALANLAERELIHRRPAAKFPNEEEYVFRQTMVREAAYATLTDADRRLGHGLAAEWLERAGESEAAVIAGHLARV